MTCTVRSVGKNSASRAISTIRHLLLWSVWATLAALALPSAAPAAGFSSAAPMSGARYLATATLLPTGRVLVAGGQGSAGYLASAELYDPSTNSWSAAGTLGAARASAVALLLPNGKVLVAGGYGATGAVASAELYDPATNSWSSGGTFVDARAYATATLLHNGRVLVAGGQGSAGDLASAELYDPATNTWSLAGTLGIARRGATASLLADGTVLVAGGVGVGGYLASAELYDPALNTWSSTGALGSARTAATATALPNGRVLIVGGESTGGTIAGVEIYDPVSRVWSLAAGSVVSRTSASATLLPDGKVLVSGGYGSSGDLVSAEIYDPATSVWDTAGSLVSARRLATATLLPSGKVLVAGGFSGSSALASAELFESSSPSWNSAGSLAPGRQFHAASLLPSGKLLVTGGFDAAYNILTSAQIYDPSVNSWSAGAPLLYPRAYHTATLTSSNRLLVVGGPGSLTAETYDFSSNTWSAAGTLAVERYQHTATLLPSGKVLVAGGQGTSFSILSSAELFTPSSNTWANAASLATARRYHTATLLPNGKLLVAGGIDSLGATLAGTEVYDPANNTWSPAAPMTAARYQHTATLLASGRVLVAGGLTANRASAELYDPSTDTWTPVASMANGRFLHVAALLASGNVLVAGGRGFSGTGAEVYDPTRNTWTAAGNLAEGRYHHTATLLTTGRVVVVGGQNSAGTALLATAEAFDIGLGFADSRRPVLTVVTDPVIVGTPVELDGIGFAGDSEASSGTTGSSPTNYPLVQFHRLDNNRLSWLSPDPANPFSGTNWISVNAIGLTPGPHAMTMFVNGIPSIADVVDIIVSSIAPSTTTIASGVNPSVAGQGVTFTGTVVGSSPTGFVSFKNGVTTIGGCGSVPLSGGQALCVTNALAIGAHSITAEYSGDSNNAASSSGVIVQIVNDASVATSIAVVDGTPQTAPRGTVFAQPLRAIVRNSANVPIAGISVLFTFPSSGPSAGLFPTMVDMVNVTTDANGVATLSLAIANVLVGSYVVTATTGGVAAPANFNLTNSPGGAASFSALPNADRTVIVGATIAPPLQVMVRDAVGDPVVGAYVRFQLNTGVTGATGTFPVGQAYAPDVLSQSDGVATAPAILANGVAGVWTAGAGDPFGMVPDYVTFSVTNDAIATQTSVAFISGSPQSTVVGTAFAIPLRIKVTDAGGAGVAGVAVTVTAPASGASATLSQGSPTTDANGEVVVNATANAIAGAYPISAAVSGIAQPASGFLLNTLGNSGAIATGFYHTCALTTAGGVKCWGQNVYGQLGDNSTTQRNAPVDVAGLSSGVVAVAAGAYHSCALTTAGGVKCWGSNEFGQLGDNTIAQRNTPVDVAGLTSDVLAVATGSTHTCALTMAGGVKCWGYNEFGQLGDNTIAQRSGPVDVAGLASGVLAVAAGLYHSCALTVAGGVKCWGYNGQGQLGDNTTTQRNAPVDVAVLSGGALAVAAGGSHTCALTTAGGVKCWGNNGDGQLGDNTIAQRNTPVDVAGLTSGVLAVATGNTHTCALTAAGGVKCWGNGGAGQLGDGSTTQRSTPVDVVGLTSDAAAVAAGYFHSCALTTTGGVKCWGNNGQGQLGDNSTTQRNAPVDLAGLTSGVLAVATGNIHTCALTAAGGVKCWGYNNYGQLGDNSTTQRVTPVDVAGLASGMLAIAAGGSHTCALTTAGGVKCWGNNGAGQLGDGSNTQRSMPVDAAGVTSGAVAVAAGGSHTCALTSGSGVKCWGFNGNGQLGDSSTTQRVTPVDVAGLASGVLAIAAGGSHTCALTTAGGVKCWGNNGQGQLGDSSTTQRNAPVDVAGLASGVLAIAAGGGHTCALTTTGGVKCWGNNGQGQLGDNSTTQRIAPVDVAGLASGVLAIAAGGIHTCALTTAGGVKCWGYNGYGSLGDNSTTQRNTPVDVAGLTSGIQAVAAGSFHTCALTMAGGVKCWGYNGTGQIGLPITSIAVVPLIAAFGPDYRAIQSFAGIEQTAPLNGPFATGLTVLVTNADGNPMAGDSVNFVVPVSGASATLSSTSATTGADGRATVSASANAVAGSYTVTATVGGANYPGVFFLANVQAAVATTTVVTSNNNPSVFGSPVTLTATVTGNSPTGTVDFLEGGIGIPGCSAVLLAGGQASCVTSALAVGSHAITAHYAGDGGNAPSNSASLTQTVNGLPVAIAVIAGSPQTTVVGTAFATSLRIKVTDAGGTGVAGVAVTVTAPASGASAMLTQLAPNTDANGEVVVNATANSIAGAYSITATASGVAQPASGYLLNTLGNAGSIEAGGHHSCALTAAGGVKCWGNNGQGQLGDNSTTQRNAPVDVAGLSSGVVAVAAGDAHTCALTTAGGVKCWGYNVNGQLGDNSTTQRSAPVDVVGLSSGVVAVAAGGNHSCALTTAGGVKCWGYNGSGQLGDNSTTPRNAPVDVAGFSSGAVAVAAGDHYTCARTAAGGVKCWGNNASGQLGDGTLLASPVPVFVSGFPGSPASITPSGGDLQSASINTNFAQKLQATVLDSSSAPVAGVQVTFNLPASGASGTFNTAGNPTQAVVNTDAAGVALSPWFVTANSVVGNWQATATVGALPAAIFNLMNASGAPASIVANAGTPQTTFTSTLFGEVLQAAVKDSLGNPIVGATVTFKTPTTGASATFPGALRTVTAITDAGGMASSLALTANGTAGTFNATAQIGALTANYSLTSILRSGSTIAPSTGTPQTTIVNTPYGAQLVAVVKDAGNNSVPGITVTFTLPGGTGASGTFATGGLTRVEITNASGIVTSPVITANTKKGAFVATARATGLAVPASFSLTNVPDVPATVTARVGAQTATVYLDFARALSVQVKDQFGNTIPGVNVAFALPAGPATAGFAPNGAGGQSMNVPTDVNGIATTSLLTANDTVGTYQATATAGAAPPATFALTNRIVSTATATILGGAGQSVVVGLPFAQPLSLIVKDSTGRTVEGVKVTFTLPAGTLSGTFPGATPTTLVTYTNGSGVATSDIVTAKTRSGTFNARATVAGLAGSTNFALTVLPDVPFRATASVGAQSVAAGSAFARAPSLYVTDQYNNRVPGVPVSFAMPATGPSGVFGAPVNGIAAPVTTDANGVATSPLVTANLFVGAYQAVATISGLPNVTFNLTNTVGAGATIVSDGGSPQTTAINTQFALPLQAWVRNAGGFDLQGLNVTFTVATTRASFVGSATPGRVVVPTLANGRASTPPVLATGIRASYNATATAAGVTGSVTFALTNN